MNATTTTTRRETVLASFAGLSSLTDTDDETLYATVKAQEATIRRSGIASAVIVHFLAEVRGHTLGEIAKNTGLTPDACTKYHRRGAILSLLAGAPGGQSALETAWSQLAGIGSKALMELAGTLTSAPVAKRPALVMDASVRPVVSARLGESATPERIDAIMSGLADDGIVTGKAAKDRVAAVAERLDIALPKVVREARESEAPSFVAWLNSGPKAVADFWRGVDAEHPAALTDADATTLREVIDALSGVYSAVREARRASAAPAAAPAGASA